MFILTLCVALLPAPGASAEELDDLVAAFPKGVLLDEVKTIVDWRFEPAEGWVAGNVQSLLKKGWSANDAAKDDELFFVRDGMLRLRDMTAGTPVAGYTFGPIQHGRIEFSLGNDGVSTRSAHLRVLGGSKALWQVSLLDKQGTFSAGGGTKITYSGNWRPRPVPHVLVWDVEPDGTGGKVSLYFGSAPLASSRPFMANAIPSALELRTGFGSATRRTLLLGDLKVVSGDSRPPAAEAGQAGLSAPIFPERYYAKGVGTETGFTPDSSKTVHPVPGLRRALHWYREPSRAAIERLAKKLLTIPETEIGKRVAAGSTRVSGLRHPDAPAAEALALMHQWTGEEKYARHAAALVTALADLYAWKGWTYGGGFDHALSAEVINAYDLVYRAPCWKELRNCTGESARDVVEAWFRKSAFDFRDYCGATATRRTLHNCVPYSVRRVAGAGVVLNDPSVVRAVIPALDRFFRSGASFHSDGMYSEGALVYHGMVTSNNRVALDFLARQWRDPAGYTDTEYGLSLDRTDLQQLRYPFLARAETMGRILRFPDGSPVALHDHYRRKPGEFEEQQNIELYDYGHFSLTRAATPNGMQAHLHFCPVSTHGHIHQDRLQLILWSAGRELLPDTGYAKNAHRYHFTTYAGHNLSLPVGGDGTPAPGWPPDAWEWLRSGLLAYDPGDVSGKTVQFVAAQSPGPAHEKIAVRERKLLLVAVDEERSYLFDVFHLRGGTLHQSFLRQQEDEDCTMECSLDFGSAASGPATEAPDFPVPTGSGKVDGMNKGILRVRTSAGMKRIPLRGVKLTATDGRELDRSERRTQIIARDAMVGFYETDGKVTEIRALPADYVQPSGKGADGMWPYQQDLVDRHCQGGGGLPIGYSMLPGYAGLFKEPRFGDGKQEFSFTWTGKDRGTALRCFLNGLPNTDVVMARGPRLAGNYSTSAKSLPAWYLSRNREVAPTETTCFGAVYDAWRPDAGPRVKSVTWLAPAPAHPMAIAARVVLDSREDLVYISSDTLPRQVGDVAFAGRASVLSKREGVPAWAYVYGQGSVTWADGKLDGVPDVRTPLKGVQSRDAGDPRDALVVQAELPPQEQLKGVWTRVVHGDTSANGFRIVGSEKIGERTAILIHGTPGFKLSPDGTTRTHFPQSLTIAGQPMVEIARPRFRRSKP